MTEREHFTAQREAVKETVRRTGPTAGRYRSALERYLAAVAGERPETAPPRTHRPAPWTDTVVRNVMTENVIVVDENASVKQIVDTLVHNRVGALPVVDGVGRVVGLVSESDLLAKVASGGDPTARIGNGHGEHKQARRKARAETAAALMSAPVVTVSPEDSVVHAARVAAHAHLRRLPVVDDERRIVGIVTRSDLLRVFLCDDEEIRGYVSELIIHRFGHDPQRVTAAVTDGVVDLRGEVNRKLTIPPLLDAVRGVAGVVAVHDHLTYRFDDDTLVPPPQYPW